MSSLKSIIVRYFTLNKFGLWILLVVILLILATLYAYNYFFLPNERNKKFKQLPNDPAGESYAYGSGKSVNIMYFSVDWCPHCKNSQNDWTNFAANYNNRVIHGYTITCEQIDCTNPKSITPVNVKQYIEKYDIKGYPTVKMVKDGKVIDFDAKVTNTALTKFVENLIEAKNESFFKSIEKTILP
jgi:thiol-disulfide isomerase/thioredoxin